MYSRRQLQSVPYALAPNQRRYAQLVRGCRRSIVLILVPCATWAFYTAYSSVPYHELCTGCGALRTRTVHREINICVLVTTRNVTEAPCSAFLREAKHTHRWRSNAARPTIGARFIPIQANPVGVEYFFQMLAAHDLSDIKRLGELLREVEKVTNERSTWSQLESFDVRVLIRGHLLTYCDRAPYLMFRRLSALWCLCRARSVRDLEPGLLLWLEAPHRTAPRDRSSKH